MPNPPLDPYGNSIPDSPGSKVIVTGAGLRYPLRTAQKMSAAFSITDSPTTDETILDVTSVPALTVAAKNGLTREQLRLTGQNVKAESYNRQSGSNIASIVTNGTVYYMSIGLFAGDVVTNMLLWVQVAGASMTLSKAGLYSSAGTRLALSADQAAAWESAGIKVIPLTAPYTVLADGLYYAAFVGTGGTAVTPVRGAGTQVAAGLVTGGARAYATQAGQADLPSTATFADANQVAYWIAVN